MRERERERARARARVLTSRDGPVKAILREWDAERECLVVVEEEEKRASLEQRLRSDAGFVSGMLRYDPKWRETWGAISSHISRETISRIQPVSKRIGIGGEPDFIGSLGSAAERDLERQLASASGEPSPAPGRGYCREDSKCFYSDVPGRSAGGSSAWGRELTALHMDKTPMLEAMVAGGLGGRYPEVLGELEFAFVSFLMCQSLAGFVAWRNLVGLVLGCEEAHLSARTDFCVAFLGVLRGQLVLAARSEAGGAEGFFGDLVAEEGFLRRTFGNFFEMVGEADVVPLALEEEAARLKETVERTLGISVTRARTQRPDHEEDEYAPVVVDL